MRKREIKINKDKCVQEPRPKGFVFIRRRRTRTRRRRRKKQKTTTTSDISSRALMEPIVVHDEKIVYLRNYNTLNGIIFN